MAQENTNAPMHHVTLHKDKKKWYKRWWIWLIAIILLIIVVSASSSNSSNTKTGGNAKSASSSQASKKAAPTYKIGQPADDGKFEFTVTSIKCGNPSVADSTGYITKTAQGQYCLLNLSVKNIGNEAQTLDSMSQYLFNANNQKYSSDDEATIDINPSSGTFLNDINPGNTVNGTVVFDIPKDQTPVTAELHDSTYSNGVKISLQ
jgi:uncharacterized protein DUF4352